MKKTRSFLLTAGIAFATAFTFSCTSDIETAEGKSSSSEGDSSSSVAGGGGVSSSSDGSGGSSSPSGGSSSSDGGLGGVSSSSDGSGGSSSPGGGSSSSDGGLGGVSSSSDGSGGSSSPGGGSSSSDGGLGGVSSSSESTPSSSSIAFSSSSYGGLCAGFDPKAEVEHYGKMKKQFCDERDGQKYVYVVIGEQTWMAENLNYEAYGDGKCYDRQPYNCTKYGRLYNWEKANRNCPSGWHLPTKAEWNALSNYVQSDSGCSSCDARLLKATSGWNNGTGNGTDDYGFSALPGGLDNSNKSEGAGSVGHWWSATQDYGARSFYRHMNYAHDDINPNSVANQSASYSVRCLQNKW